MKLSCGLRNLFSRAIRLRETAFWR